MDTITYYLSLTGKTPIDLPLKKDTEYSIAFQNIEIYKVEDKSGQGDGDQMTFVGRSKGIVTILDGREVVYGRNKSKQSQALRMALKAVYDSTQPEEYTDFDDYYKHRMSQFIDQVNSEII